MAQLITDNRELLDGEQIRNKLAICLKSGQTAYAVDDKKCYDKGQISAKYNVNITEGFTLSPTGQLIPHLAYTPKITLKGPYSTAKFAYQATIWTERVYIDTGFTGNNAFDYRIGSKLYASYNKDGDYAYAPEGCYVYSQAGNQANYLIINTTGTITGIATYTADGASDVFQYAEMDSTWNVDLHSMRQNLNGSNAWSTVVGTIYRRTSDSKWYNVYDPNTDTWSTLSTGAYVFNYDSLIFRYLRVSAGVQQSSGLAYKRTNFTISTYSSTAPATQTVINISVSSYIKWQVVLTAGSGYATLSGTTQADGNGTFTITIAANSGSQRAVSFRVYDRASLGVSDITGTITQNMSIPTPNSINLRYSSITAQNAAAQTLSNTYYYYGTFGTGTTLYTNSTASNYAPLGFYMNPTNRVYWFIGGTNGYISSTAVYYSGIDLFTYCHYSTSQTLEQAVAYATNNSLWGTSAGTIRKNGDDNKWYSGYDSTTGIWSNLVTGVYIQSNSTHGALVYDWKNISNGVATEGTSYKNPNITLSYDTGYMSSDGGTRTISVTGGVKWVAIITSSNASISGSNWGDGSGSFVISVGENTGAPRDISFTVSERVGISGVSSKYGVFGQLEPAGSYVAVPYYGFLAYDLFTFDLADDKSNCYYSWNSGTLYYSAGQYYSDTSLTLYADYGMYMLYKGVNGYPTFSDSEFLILQ